MIRTLTASAATLLLASSAASANDARTTRVIQDHVYGATVTVEEGVRVFRPLPPDRNVIVNPEGDTEIEIREYNVTGPRR